ncbi:MAG: DUF4364 family protein [Clostridia bacterium]|nr:DUF4364 family protein [Clostridia bacterium]
MANYEFKNANEIRIFILHILKNMPRPVSFSELNDMVRQDELVSYVDFAENLAQLVENGNVNAYFPAGSEDIGQVYEITQQGIYVAEQLESEIAGYVRTRSLKSALRYLSFKEDGTEAVVRRMEEDDGRILMTFLVKNRAQTMMELRVVVDNDYQADQMELQFRDNPETVYRSILSLLAGDAGYLFG